MLDEEIQAFLRSRRIGLNTDLGQHFLTDEGVLQEILDAADIRPTDRIVEIGPGIGVLTRELAQRAKHVTAIEIDARFIPLLKDFVGKAVLPKITVINENALQVRIPTDAPYKIAANIPYHITSPLLRHLLLETDRTPSTLTLLIQREVAENIASDTGSNLVGILVQLFGTPRIVCHVPPECFLPPPEVDSAVVHVDCFAQPKVDQPTARKVLNLAKVAFSQRRKMLNNTVGKLPNGMEALHTCGIDPKRRPETLTIDEWIAIQSAL
jgi:16S rRNA (adenine1518-N6/adenine1519-N6)-dimethyltransferase